MATSTLGRLTLDLLLKLGPFEQGLSQAERKTKQSADKMGGAFAGFKKQVADALGGTQIGGLVDGFNSKIGSIRGNVLVAGAALAGMAVGGTLVAVAGLSKLAIETAKADVELQVLANRAHTSVENFQILAHAAAGLGVNQEQLGAQLADVQEKLGEFSADKAGGAADFFEALQNNTKMSDDQIKAFIKTLQNKDGIDAIQLMNDKLDDLGVTSQERRFVFESLAGDLGNLAPLFAENGKLLGEYGDALRDAGVIKTQEAMDQSRVLAAQTEALQIRYKGFKDQLASQMMPVLNNLISHFVDGSAKGGQFGSIISSVGVIAKGVGLVIIGLAAGIRTVVIAISSLAQQAANISITAQNVMDADGVKAKARALGTGLKEGFAIGSNAMGEMSAHFTNTLDSMSKVMNDNAVKATDPLAEALLKTSEAAQQSAEGLKIDTEQAKENAKAKDDAAKATAKAAKENEKLNAMVGASALNGLRIKSSEAFAGGQVRGYTANFAQMVQSQLGSDLARFTAFNDLYHKGTNSKHATGNAFDFTLNDASKSGQAVAQLESLAKRYGYVIKVLDEYKRPSARATGGHLHVSVLGFKGTAGAAKQAQDELSLVEKTNQEAQRLIEERMRAQQSVISQYYTEAEKIEYDHGEKLKAIQMAFAGDQDAINKYLKLQEAAYKKDVEEYTAKQKLKSIADQKALLEVRKNWMSASQFASEYYALVREEILATSEYSPDMQHALLKQANIEQGVAENSEREGVWENYKSRFGLEKSPYQQDIDLLAAAKQQMLITEEQYQQQRIALQMGYGAQYGASFAGSLMGLVDQTSSAYMILGGIQKGAALYSTALNSYQAISAAWASAPFPYNLGAVATATVQTGLLQAAISALTPGFATGGHITGAGTKTSDSINIRASNGEFMMRAAAVDALGVGTMDAINSNPAAFKAKFLDTKSGSTASNYVQHVQSAQAQSANVNLNPNFVIVDERQSIGDYLFSPDGTKAFVKFFKKNKRELGMA